MYYQICILDIIYISFNAKCFESKIQIKVLYNENCPYFRKVESKNANAICKNSYIDT